MKAQIGLVAGKIWGLLNEKGELGMSTISRHLNEPSPVVHQAVGWLAREDKIEITSKKGKTYITLIHTASGGS